MYHWLARMRFIPQVMDRSSGGFALSFYVCVLRSFIVEVRTISLFFLSSLFMKPNWSKRRQTQRIPRTKTKRKLGRGNIRPATRRGKRSIWRRDRHWADERKCRWNRQQLCQDRRLGRVLEEIACRVHRFVNVAWIWSIGFQAWIVGFVFSCSRLGFSQPLF